MKNIDFDKMWIGASLGLLFPFIVFMLYYQIYYSFMDIYKFIRYLNLGHIFSSVVTLCVLANLAVFYPFLWKEKYYGGRGVLLSTFIWGGFILYIKFLIES
jgi:hypothetical protein